MADARAISWQTLVSAVRSDCPDLYRTWWEDLGPTLLEGGQLSVRVDDPLQIRYLRDNCTAAFVRAGVGRTRPAAGVSYPAPMGRG